MEIKKEHILVLGVGNLLLNDEGVGIKVVQTLEQEGFTGADLLDGGTGGFHLLGFLQGYKHILFIDATLDDNPPGTVRVLHPRYAHEFPQQLSAHEIGLKDLIDACALLGNPPVFHLIAISVKNFQDFGIELTPEVAAAVPEVIHQIKSLIDSIHS